MNRLQAVAWFGVLSLPFLAGCPKVPRQTPLMKTTQNVRLPAAELRLRVRELAPKLGGIVEEAADEIRSGTDDPDISRAALRWKMEVIPTSNQAIYRGDPLLALMDIWAFTLQHQAYLETGAGREWFGAFQPVAVEAARAMEAAVEGVAARISTTGSVSEVEDRFDEWAEDHPIAGPSFGRESMVSYVADVATAKRAGGFAAMGTLTSDVADIATRLDLFADQIPKQARWQAEYVLEEFPTGEDLDRTLQDVARLADAMERAGAVVEQGGNALRSLAGEPGGIVGLVERERDAVLEAAGRQLGVVLESVTRERMAIMDEMRSEREIVLEALGDERLATFEALGEERAIVMEETQAIAARIVDRAGVRIERAIDHLFWRLAQLLVMLVVLVGLGGVLMVRSRRASPA